MELFLFLFIFFVIFMIFIIYKDNKIKKHKKEEFTRSRQTSLCNNETMSASISSSVTLQSATYESFFIRDVSKWEKYHQYKVKGKNPETNRLKTCIVVAKEGTPNNEIALKSGFNEPFTVILDSESFEERHPSEKQINYAKELDFHFPANCTCADASCLISRRIDNLTDNWIPYELYKFISENGFKVSPYESLFGGVCVALNCLDGADCLAFFSYLIYCVTHNLNIGNMYESIHKAVFYKFAETYIDNEQIWDAMHFEDTHICHLLNKKRFDARNKKKGWLFNTTNTFLSEHITSN